MDDKNRYEEMVLRFNNHLIEIVGLVKQKAQINTAEKDRVRRMYGDFEEIEYTEPLPGEIVSRIHEVRLMRKSPNGTRSIEIMPIKEEGLLLIAAYADGELIEAYSHQGIDEATLTMKFSFVIKEFFDQVR